ERAPAEAAMADDGSRPAVTLGWETVRTSSSARQGSIPAFRLSPRILGLHPNRSLPMFHHSRGSPCEANGTQSRRYLRSSSLVRESTAGARKSSQLQPQ